MAAVTPKNYPYIFVSKSGNDRGSGTSAMPYLTLTKAFDEVTSTRNTIFVQAGVYEEAEMITWPNVNGVSLIGMDGHANITVDSGTAVIKIDPTFTASNLEAFIDNVGIELDGTHGLWIDNAAMTKKLIVHVKKVAFSGETVGSADDAIHLDHTTAGQTMKLYVDDCKEIEGVVNITPGNDSDIFKFDGCELAGGLTFGNVAKTASLTLLNCMRLTGDTGTGNAATMVTIIGCWHRTNDNVFTTYTDAFSE